MKIKDLRMKLSLSQTELANILGVSIHTLRNWEQGRRMPDLETVINICDRFNISVDWLLEREKEDINNKAVYDALQAMLDLCERFNKDDIQKFLLEKMEN